MRAGPLFRFLPTRRWSEFDDVPDVTGFMLWLQPPSPLPSVEAFWPMSFIGWLTAAGLAFASARWLVNKIRHWGTDTKSWNDAAKALQQLSKDVSELLYEIRGINGRGGINARLDTIEHELELIKERNTEADLLVEIYKADLRERREKGKPIRRDVDALIDKLSPEPT